MADCAHVNTLYIRTSAWKEVSFGSYTYSCSKQNRSGECKLAQKLVLVTPTKNVCTRISMLTAPTGHHAEHFWLVGRSLVPFHWHQFKLIPCLVGVLVMIIPHPTWQGTPLCKKHSLTQGSCTLICTAFRRPGSLVHLIVAADNPHENRKKSEIWKKTTKFEKNPKTEKTKIENYKEMEKKGNL